jgi:hypothetical protein
MANVTTVDSRVAIIQVTIVEDFVLEINRLLEYLKLNYRMQEVDPAGNP